MRLINSSVYYHHQHHHSSPSTSTSLCTPEPALLHLLLLFLSLPPLFHLSWNAFFLFSSPLFLLSLLQGESSGISSFYFPGQSCNYSSGEKKTSCAGELRVVYKNSEETKMKAPLRGNEVKLLIFLPQYFILGSKQEHIFRPHDFFFFKYQTRSSLENRNNNHCNE